MAVDRVWRQAWQVWRKWRAWLLAQDSGESVAAS